MKKKILDSIAVMCILTLFSGMAMASGSSSNSDGTRALTTTENNDQGNGQQEESTEAETEAANDTTIEEQVLIDENGLKITATEYTVDPIWGDGIKLLIENSSDSNYAIACDALIVNDYMIFDLFSSEITAGRNANETMYLANSELENAGIENVGKIEIDFRIYDPDSYETLFDPDTVEIHTSNYDSMDTEVDESGVELYNSDGIRIVGKYVDEDSIWGTAILIYVENNTDRNITVTCDTVAINNFMVTGYYYSSVYAERKAFDDITILSSDLEENNITTVENIAVDFSIIDSDTYETIADTGEIEFSAT